MARAAIPHLPNGGAIINTGSVTGLMGNKDLLDYSLTKGGIHAFDALARNQSHSAWHSRERGRPRTRVDSA